MKTLRLVFGLVLAIVAGPAFAQFNWRNLDLNKLKDTVSNVVQATTDLNEKQETDLGREWASVLVGAAPLVADPELQRYVNSVGRWLALHSERPGLDWHFGVLDSPNINAFATPGGFIFITNGLLRRLHSEAELAGVLSHEIIHVIRKHHLKAIQKSAAMAAGANVLAEVAEHRTRNADAVSKLVGGIKEVMLRGLDKDDEFEADRMGVVLAARGGYDPYGLPAVLQMIQGMNAASSELALLFETHPAPGARLDALDRVMSPGLESYATQPQVADRFAARVLARK